MKQNYIFTWKALGLLFIIFLTVGVCLASISGTQTQSEEATSEAASTDAPTLEVENTAELIETAQETNLVANKLATDTMVYLPYVTHNESPEPSADCGGLIQEAEAGRFYGDMRVGSDNGASGSQFIHVPGAAGQANLNFNADHRADYCVNIVTAGTYIIRGWTNSADIESDSFFVTIDNSPSQGHLWETPKHSGFQEDVVNDRGKTDPTTFFLTTGNHTLSIVYREANTKLDRFEFILSGSAPAATATPNGNTGGGGEILPTRPSEGGGPEPTPTPYSSTGNLDGWPMAGANVERTSSVAAGVNPRAESNFGVKWYRPIEAYIGQHVQLIAARDKIYAATAKGLYALEMTTGNLAWRFDTELPLGHSPTVDGDRIFVGGFDKRVYGLNADTGALLWTFEGANGGFSTNPVVIDNQVLLGSRDGYFYSINRDNGSLNWQYPPAGQNPLGPILYSAAYKDGKVYFAANDNYGYAVNISDGSLAWRSQKLPGDGYQAYWPVVYENYVIFSAASPYVEGGTPGAHSIPDGGYGFDYAKTIQRDDIYPNGKDRVAGADVAQYLERKPWRRGVILINTSNGQEYTIDTDGDGNPEYAPFLYAGTKSGNRYPPLVINGEIFAQSMSQSLSGWSISRGSLARWTPGGTGVDYVGSSHAIDEPFADSAAGNIVYTNLCCDRVGGFYEVDGGSSGTLWSYSNSLETVALDNPESWRTALAPGYDAMWWESSMYVDLPRLTGAYGGPNGIYHNHSIQSPIIPYKDMLFVHRSNAIIALGPDSIALTQKSNNESVEAYENRVRSQHPQIALPTLVANESGGRASTSTGQEVQELLDYEISKMIAAGHLRPGYYNGTRGYNEFVNAYENPGETLVTLVEAYPYVSRSLQPQLRQYIDEHYNRYFANGMIGRIGYQGLAAREWMPVPPEVQATMNSKGNTNSATAGSGWTYQQYNLYAMWKYADLFYVGDQNKLDEIYGHANSKLSKELPSGQVLTEHIWLDNGYIAGYIGFLNLQELAGKSGSNAALRNEISGKLNTLQQRRANNFSKDQPFINTSGGNYYKRSFNVARNFIYMTPEFGEYLRNNSFGQVSGAIQEYESVAPYWVSTRYEATVQEMSSDNLYTHNSMFKAKAYILNESQDQLRKYIDSPAFGVGDLHYIQTLTMSLEP